MHMGFFNNYTEWTLSLLLLLHFFCSMCIALLNVGMGENRWRWNRERKLLPVTLKNPLKHTAERQVSIQLSRRCTAHHRCTSWNNSFSVSTAIVVTTQWVSSSDLPSHSSRMVKPFSYVLGTSQGKPWVLFCVPLSRDPWQYYHTNSFCIGRDERGGSWNDALKYAAWILVTFSNKFSQARQNSFQSFPALSFSSHSVPSYSQWGSVYVFTTWSLSQSIRCACRVVWHHIPGVLGSTEGFKHRCEQEGETVSCLVFIKACKDTESWLHASGLWPRRN